MAVYKKDALELFPDDVGSQQGYINASLQRELNKVRDQYEELAKKANEEEESLSDEDVVEDERLPWDKYVGMYDCHLLLTSL